MQVTGNHLFTSTGFTLNHHADVFIGNLHDQLAYVLNLATGAHQATEQLYFATLTTTAVVGILLTIDLTTMQTIQQFVVTRRHLNSG